MRLSLANFIKQDFRFVQDADLDGEMARREDYLYLVSLPTCNCGKNHFVRISTMTRNVDGRSASFVFRSDGNGSISPSSVLAPISIHDTARVDLILEEMIKAFNQNVDDKIIEDLEESFNM